MSALLLLKTVHILSGAVLFGTGLGIAFFMLMAHRTREPVIMAGVGRMVVLADMLFTATAVVVQPITGVLLAVTEGVPLGAPWLLASYALFVLVGACWLPVVWIQMLLVQMAEQGKAASPEYRRLFRVWFALGWPAFAGVIGIYWLMSAKPA
jgi:uncharacterized membrane protein